MVKEEIKEEPEKRLVKWLNQIKTLHVPVQIDTPIILGETYTKTQIREAAYYIALKKPTFDYLCWSLAEKIQKKYNSKPTVEEIKETAEKIYYSSKTYDQLCWLNAEIQIMDTK